MELKMNEYQLPEKISFNFEELKQELTAKVGIYETMVYTDDQIKEAKADKANLNKLKKALNDERIRREKEYMVPFNAFKSQVNEIIGIIDKPVAVIDKQVKAYEEQKKQEKLDSITEAFNAMNHPEWLHLSQILDDKWLNASTSMTSVVDAMSERITQIYKDMDTLANLPEFGFEAQQIYKSSLNLNNALAEGQRMSQIQKQKEEQARLKAEAEAKAAELAMNPPVEEQLPGQMEFTNQKSFDEVMTKDEVVEVPKTWVRFQALMTVDQARMLKKFFDDNKIEFKAV